MKQELDLLEELLTLEENKKKQDILSAEERKQVEARIDALIRIAKIVSSAKKKLPANKQEGLQYVAERLLNESASAYLKEDADGRIEMTVLDSIYEPKILARMQMQKVGECLFITAVDFC